MPAARPSKAPASTSPRRTSSLKIFAGERSTGPDTQLINQILSTGASLQEISSMINSVTGPRATPPGVKAMTVDFQGYTAGTLVPPPCA